jgi:hypothetical protein
MESCEAPKLLNWPIKHGHVRRRESRQIYEVSPGAKTLSDLGISRHQSSRDLGTVARKSHSEVLKNASSDQPEFDPPSPQWCIGRKGLRLEAPKNMMKRDEIETLLPWYAAGTLSRSDADRVEQALASDQELAQCFELIRKELAETIYLNETLGAPSQRAAEKLFAAIDAEDAQSGGRRRQRLDPSPSLLASP